MPKQRLSCCAHHIKHDPFPSMKDPPQKPWLSIVSTTNICGIHKSPEHLDNPPSMNYRNAHRIYHGAYRMVPCQVCCLLSRRDLRKLDSRSPSPWIVREPWALQRSLVQPWRDETLLSGLFW